MVIARLRFLAGEGAAGGPHFGARSAVLGLAALAYLFSLKPV